MCVILQLYSLTIKEYPNLISLSTYNIMRLESLIPEELSSNANPTVPKVNSQKK